MIRAKVDLSKVSGYIDGEEDEKIMRTLKRTGLHSLDFLYSVFNGNRARVKQVQTTGNYRNPEDAESKDAIFAFTIDELRWQNSLESADPNCIKTHARQYEEPAIAVYDSSYFEIEGCDTYEYRFKKKENSERAKSLVGIVSLKF